MDDATKAGIIIGFVLGRPRSAQGTRSAGRAPLNPYTSPALTELAPESWTGLILGG